MVAICRILEQAAPPTSPQRSEGGQERVVERTAPSVLVRISDRDLGDEFLSDKISSVIVEETAQGLSMAQVRISNDRLQFTDHELLEGKSLEVEVLTGYENTRIVSRGVFRASIPKYAFRNQAMPFVTLDCYGEEWPLTVNEEREVYENLTDSQIAERIASRRGLRSDVDPTDITYEHVAHFNMTDMEFLENRALLYGYDVYVQNGTLHFHQPRYEHSGLNLLFGEGERGILNRFHVIVDPWVRGSSWTKSGVDRITGKEYEFRSEDTPDPVARRIIQDGGPGFQTAASLAEIDGNRPRRFIIGEGHLNSEGEARNQVKGFTQATEWIVQGSAAVRGIEQMKARQVVTMLGLGHLSGDYFVSKVMHRLVAGSSYTMEFEIIRPGTGKLQDRFRGVASTPGGRRDVSNLSQQLGTAVLI